MVANCMRCICTQLVARGFEYIHVITDTLVTWRATTTPPLVGRHCSNSGTTDLHGVSWLKYLIQLYWRCMIQHGWKKLKQTKPMGAGSCWSWRPELDPQNPLGWRREPTQEGRPLTFMALLGMYAHPHNKTNVKNSLSERNPLIRGHLRENGWNVFNIQYRLTSYILGVTKSWTIISTMTFKVDIVMLIEFLM